MRYRLNPQRFSKKKRQASDVMATIHRHVCKGIAAAIFLFTTLGSNYLLHGMNYSNVLSLAGALFIGVITAGIWLEVGYRFLVKQATAPLDRIIKKL